MLQIALIIVTTLFFFILERVLPGRELPEAPGWYSRAAFLNACQIGLILLAGAVWDHWFQRWSLFHVAGRMAPILQGLLGWFIGTFVFYWWHRLRHDSNFLWRICHQVHHSPTRIELLTAFYKHPLEITADSMIVSALMFSFLGTSLAGAAWYNVFAVIGEYFYHSNLRTPHWMGTSYSDPNTTPSITNSICIASTTATSPGGIASSAPSAKPMSSPPDAASPIATNETWDPCSSSATVIKRFNSRGIDVDHRGMLHVQSSRVGHQSVGIHGPVAAQHLPYAIHFLVLAIPCVILSQLILTCYAFPCLSPQIPDYFSSPTSCCARPTIH